MTEYAEWYFDFLRSRSFKCLVYRKFWLFPILRRYVKGRVLDVGPGIGDFLRSFPGSIGADPNPRIVEFGRRQGLNIVQMREGKLPFDSHSFDTVVLDNVLEHIEEPADLLLEIRRVLVPGGRFLVGVPGPKGFATAPDHKVFYDEPGLVRTLSEHGFNVERMFHTPVKSKLLYEKMSQYILYGLFRTPSEAAVAQAAQR